MQGLDLPVPVAQEPIGRSTGLAPNVLIIMDDSHSMDENFMPETLKQDSRLTKLVSSGNCNKNTSLPPTFACISHDPAGWIFDGLVWYDSKADFPINLIRFDPRKEYLPWPTGEARPSPNADLPRVKDTPQELLNEKRRTRVFSIDKQANGTWAQDEDGHTVRWWVDHNPATIHASETSGTLPPLYILRNNEQNIKRNYNGVDDPSKVSSYFLINFALDKNFEYHHTEVFDMDDRDNWNMNSALTKDYGNTKAWPDNQKFSFIDKNGQLIFEGTPKELFKKYWNYLFYHHSRHSLARSVLLEVFADRDEQIRLGFTTLHHGGEAGKVWQITPNTAPKPILYRIPVLQDGGLFTGKNRRDFLDHVTNYYVNDGYHRSTPLRSPLHNAGKYFSDTTSSDNPYKAGDKTFSCRQNISILVTDGGYYRETASGWDDWDSTPDRARATPIVSTTGAHYRYEPVAPYRDRANGQKYNNTLADVAMYYWLNDLVPDSVGEVGTNNVPTTGRDPAFWQHMRTYAISFGEGESLDTSVAPGLPGARNPSGRWLNPAADGQSAVMEDLWHAAVNGHGQYFASTDNVGLARALRAVLDEANPGKGPGSTNAASAYLFTDVQSGEVLQFSASYNASDLSSSLVACKLGTACADGVVWDASERLAALQQDKAKKLERNILFTADPAAATLKPFQWENLSGAQKMALANGDKDLGEETVRYLRGDATLDDTTIAHPDSTDAEGAKWRTRAELVVNGSVYRNVLGMIVHGSPTFIGAPEDIRTELTKVHSGYEDFQHAHKDRPTMLYVASNDGMVHAFLTESKTLSVNSGNGITTTRTFEAGDEVFAFIPSAAINKNMRDFTRTSFAINQHYLLDGALNYSEVKIGNQWKTVLVGSMGAAGGADDAPPAVFALDVTDPGNPKLLWEKTDPAMGQTMGTPVIAPMADGKWSVFIGSGPNQGKTTSNSAILKIDVESGDVTVLQSTDMAATSKGGILGLHVVDADHDGYADTIYAGDLAGNVWKVSNLDKKAGSAAQYARLFQAPQPITAPLTSTTQENGTRWLFFGAGRALTDGDLIDTKTVRTWYGIQDTGALVKDNELVERHYEVIKNFQRNNAEGATTDAVVMNYAVAGDMDGKKGWKIPLNQSGDAATPGYMLLQNRIRNGLLVGQMNFSIKPEPSCEGLNATSRLMVLDPFTGSVSPDADHKTNIDVNDDGKVDENDMYSGTTSGAVSGANGAPLPIVGLGFGTGELSGSILIVQEQRTRGSLGAASQGLTPGVSGKPQDDIESTRSCAIDSRGVRVCLPPSPEGKPPSIHTWTELRYDDAP